VGVDISEGMVNQYNYRVSNQGIAPDEMKAVCVELKGEEGELGDAKFDVIVVRLPFKHTTLLSFNIAPDTSQCSLAYHHFPSIDAVTRILAFFLKPGGSLLVADLMRPVQSPEGTSTGEHHLFPESVHHIVPHKDAFEESDLRRAFEGAGLTDFVFNPNIGSATLHQTLVDFFLARGTKAAE
jgi:SAM-dependent methyltransferase